MEEAFESREEMTMKKKKKKRRKNLDVEMEALSEVADRTAPLVGYFPSGFDPLKVKEDPTVRVFRNKKRVNRLELVVSPKGSNVEFIGKSYAGEAAGPQHCTYALGVLDKERQSLRIVPIATNKILRMEPRVLRKTSVDNELHVRPKDEELTKEKREEKLRELTALYGSKKDKSRDQKWVALTQQQDDPKAQENLKGKLKDVEINEEAIEDATRKVILNIPPHDPAASSPENAYLLDEIIFKWERDHLLDILEHVQSGEIIATTTKFWQENGYPSFVYNRIHELRDVQDAEEKKKLAFIFSYITHLVKFMDIAKKTHGSNSIACADSANYHNIPRIIFQKFVKLFVNPESQALSKETKDLLISYILVLTLFADKFETDASDIAKDLKVTYMTLRPYYEQLGCKAGSVKAVTLPVPLQLSRFERKKRRR